MSNASQLSSVTTKKTTPTPHILSRGSLLDELLNDYFDFICDKQLEVFDSFDSTDQSGSESQDDVDHSLKKQLLLVKTCFADIRYAKQTSGLSNAKKTTQYHLSDFLRRLEQEPDSAILQSAVTMLNCVLKYFLARESSYQEYRNKRQSYQTRKLRATLATNRHRQYYNKRVAQVFSGPLPKVGIKLYLYKFSMDLICPIPDEQNRKGRRIVDPKESSRNFAIVCSQKLPQISPFPLFTRSGEVRIYIQLVDCDFELDQNQVDNLKKFHEFTFSRVLRLEKYPIRYEPEKSPFPVLLAPVCEGSAKTYIDWDFVQKIVQGDKNTSTPTDEERNQFQFKYEDYSDAVVIPWYRMTDCQEFAYYVAHICTNLSPCSPFPDRGTGYTSFIDYYNGKYNINVFHRDQPILDVDRTSARLNLLTPRYVNRKGITLPSSTAKTIKESRESLSQKQLLIPELCFIHPFPASFWRKTVCLPCVFYRLNSLYLAEELRRAVARETKVGFIEPPEDVDWEPLDFGWFPSNAIQQDNEMCSNNPIFGELLPDHDFRSTNVTIEAWKDIKFDPTMDEFSTIGPSPSLILQALTMSNASDGINLERLETVGDSFLKYSITAYLYCDHPTLHEGKLSHLRSMEISNKNLYDLGKSKNLGTLMSATKFEPNDNWLAPGYCVDRSQNESEEEDESCNKKREIDKALAEVPYDLLMQHSIPNKSIADCVEALIGAYLTSSGSRAALLFMQWLGLKVITPSIDTSFESETDTPKTVWRWLKVPESPLSLNPFSIEDSEFFDITLARQKALLELDKLYYDGKLDEFEESISYKFKDRAYLVQAFSHNSYIDNQVTKCYQRLEFLGDALLDYLITRYLFQDPRCHSPGTLTDLRSALVNNTFFASLAVKYNFHKYLKYIHDDLHQVINSFVTKFLSDSEMTTKGYTLLIFEGESEYAEDTEVPKALGDVFESVAGAIYLDSGMSLDTVWRVYFKMMKPEIEYFSVHIPKSPIRELLESNPQNVRFSPSEMAVDRKHRVMAEVFGVGKFIGLGRNKHSAKCTAAKRALRALKALKDKENKI